MSSSTGQENPPCCSVRSDRDTSETSVEAVTAKTGRRRHLPKQRSVGEAFSDFVGNGARRFRSLVTRMNRQRRYGSIPNIPWQTADAYRQQEMSSRCEPRSNRQQIERQDSKTEGDRARAVCVQNEAVLRLLMKRERDRKISLSSAPAAPQRCETGEQTTRCTELTASVNPRRFEPGGTDGECGRFSASALKCDSACLKDHCRHSPRAPIQSVQGQTSRRQTTCGVIDSERPAPGGSATRGQFSENVDSLSRPFCKDTAIDSDGSKDSVGDSTHDCEAKRDDRYYKGREGHDTIPTDAEISVARLSEVGVLNDGSDIKGVGERHLRSCTTERNHTGRAFGRYIGKKAGRFRALVLRLNARNSEMAARDGTDRAASSTAKQDASVQNEAQHTECRNRAGLLSITDMDSVSYSHEHHSDTLTSGSASGSSVGGSGGGSSSIRGGTQRGVGEGGGGADALCGSSDNESRLLATDSHDSKYKNQPRPNPDTTRFSNEVQKKQLQRLRNETMGSLSYDNKHPNYNKEGNCAQERNTAVLENNNGNMPSSNEEILDQLAVMSTHSTQQANATQRTSQSNVTCVEIEQRNSVAKPVDHPAVHVVTSNPLRTLPPDPDRNCQTWSNTASASGQNAVKTETTSSKRKNKPAKKPFYKQISFDRLATFVAKRSGHFHKFIKKSDSHDCVMTVVQSSQAKEEDIYNQTLMTKVVSLKDICMESSINRCTSDSAGLQNGSEITRGSQSSDNTFQASPVDHQWHIDLNSASNKYICDISVTEISNEEYSTQGLDVLVLGTKQGINKNKENDGSVMQNIKNSEMLQFAESTPSLLEVGCVSEKKVLSKTQSCSPRFLRDNHKENPDFSQILTFLNLSSIVTASNERLLCKLGVDSLIDISSVAFESPQQQRAFYPCLSSKHNHFRSRLNINIEDIEWENIEEHFLDINKFIEGARLSSKSVLVYSYHGNSRAAAVVIQYLMRHFRMSVSAAYNLVVSRRPSVCLNPGFQKALKRLELKLFAEWKETSPACVSDIEHYMLKPVVKQAWTGSLESRD